MTWTSAVGRSCKWLLYKIVHGLALTRISPNALTFIGLLINIGAGCSSASPMPKTSAACFSMPGW